MQLTWKGVPDMNEEITGTEITGEGRSSIIAPVLISGIVGAGLALLLTPKSGREIRQDLRRYASRAGEQPAETAGAAQAQALEAPAAEEEAIAEAGQGSFIVPILVSGVIGAAVALLFAPKPGSEMISDLKDMASSAFEKSKGWYQQGATTVKEAIEKGKEAAAESKAKLRPAA
jgi:gas vesicle protein